MFGLFCISIVAGLIILIVILACNDYRGDLNAMNGRISSNFTREAIEPRSDYTSKLEKYNVFYYNEAALEWPDSCAVDEYWNEKGMLKISTASAYDLRRASLEIHTMSLNVVDQVVNDNTNRLF